MIKSALKNFFDKMLEFNLKHNRDYLKYDMFKTNIDMKIIAPEMYVHVEENGYVYWLPIEKQNNYDFSKIEQDFGIKIHQDIKDYFNSYYFLELLTGTPDIGDIYIPS